MSSKRLGTATSELYYDEYVQRRNRELDGQRSSSAGRRPESKDSSNGRPSSKSSKASSGSSNSGRPSSSKKNAADAYAFEPHAYKPIGYKTFKSELGDDPLTALKILKTRIRNMSITTDAKSYPIKKQLCQQANNDVSKAEKEMEGLAAQRSQAILQGNTTDANEISKKMNDLRDRATYTAYSDLLLEENKMSSMGVKSDWTPPPVEPDDDDLESKATKPKKKEPEVRLIRTMSARKRDRLAATKKDEGPVKDFRPLTAPKPPKRNERLFGNVVNEKGTVYGATVIDDPFKQPSTIGVCVFCFEQNVDFSREVFLKQHMAECCPCLTRCDFCDKVIEVQTLNEHQLERCRFVENHMVPCELCGLACYDGEKNHPRCRKMAPPEDSAWCPLCSIAVKPFEDKKAWQKHLRKDCYNNPRKNLSGVPSPAVLMVQPMQPGFDVDGYHSEPQLKPEPDPNAIDPSLKPENVYDGEPPAEPVPEPVQEPYPPPQYPYPPYPVYGNNITADAIRQAFQAIKENRKAETEKMREEEAAREKIEEAKAEAEAKRLEKEVAAIKKKQEEEKKSKKKKR
uniref:TRAF-type domain-containing protein n=1 Tax=Panagrellus redivivus TaxID=6233 RepID=A0A7E4UW70_PANRE